MAATSRVFPLYRRWMVPLLSATFVASMFVLAALCTLVPLLAPLLVLGYVYLTLNYLMLFGNGWLRRRLDERLRSLGEPADHRLARFVGLSYPCHNHTFARRMVETDDDVGFLTIVPEGLIFHGDGVHFTVPAGNIAEVHLARTPYAPWSRVEVVLADGEPYDSITLDSRNHAHHGACRRDNLILAGELRRLIKAPTASAAVRLTGEVGETSSISL